MKLFAYEVSLTTVGAAVAGTFTAYAGKAIRGRIHAIKFEIGTLTNTVDLTITGETSGVPILVDSPAADEWFYPKVLVNKSSDGSQGTDAFQDIHVFAERIKIAGVQGGTDKVGTITFYVEEY